MEEDKAKGTDCRRGESLAEMQSRNVRQWCGGHGDKRVCNTWGF